MWQRQYFIPYPYIIVPIMIITTTCHTPKNNTDVIIAYSNHAEAEYKYPEKVETTMFTTSTTEKITTEKEVVSSDEGVVFVPDERRMIRNEEYLRPEPAPLSISDILTHESIKDMLGGKEIQIETEKPIKEDIIFVSGKNKEIDEKKTEKKKQERHKETELIDEETETKKPIRLLPKLNCTNLNCNNNIESVCGAKLEHKTWKYRLFLNDCFFRKVNCHFSKKENRYMQVKIDYCKPVAIHHPRPPQVKKEWQRPVPEAIVQIDRRSNARRSSTLNLNGQMCEHLCPTSCNENYDPECAISETGHKKVFVNHCKMDLNSCTFGIVWQRRPLADCVGGKKADLQQNRGFINWMQSVGIVDKKGRLSLS